MQFQFQLLAAFASLAAARNVLIAAPGGADFFTQEVISNWALMPEDLGTWEACYWDGTAPFCAGGCPDGWRETERSSCGDGACCWTGIKTKCCK